MSLARRGAASPVQAPRAAYAAICLRRAGLRPLRFHGCVLLQAEDSAEPAFSWMRLAVYATDQGDFVFEILCRPGGAPAALPWGQAGRVPNLAAAMARFEAAVSRAELIVPDFANDDAGALLVECIDAARRESAQTHAMQHAIGNFLHRLCQVGENPGDRAC